MRLRLPGIACISFTAVLTLLACGCVMSKIPAYTSSAAGSPRAQVKEAAGLRVSVDPFFDKQRSEEFFRVNGLRDGIAIVHVKVSNVASGGTVLVRREDFRLVLGEATVTDVAGGIDRSTAAGEAVAITGAALLSLPMLFAGGKLLSDATVIRHNFSSKEFRSQTLAPGESADGFLYFQFDKKQRANFVGTLSFAVRNSQTQLTETLEFAMPYEK